LLLNFRDTLIDLSFYSYPTINAGIATLQHEIRYAKIAQDNIAKERDKVKSDLQVYSEPKIWIKCQCIMDVWKRKY